MLYICIIGTAVPSELIFLDNNIYMEGGLILLKLENKNENEYNIDSSCEIFLEYVDRDNRKHEQKYDYKIPKDNYTQDYFSSKTIEHGICLYYYTNLCIYLLNYKNAYNENTFINLNQRSTQENMDRIQNDIKKYEKYHNKSLLENVIEFLTMHYNYVEGLINHSDRYIEKINNAFKLDTPKRYQGE